MVLLRSGKGPTPQMKSFHLLQLKMLNMEKNCQWNKIITAIFKVKKKFKKIIIFLVLTAIFLTPEE